MRLIDLMPLQEIDFPNQRAFDQYNKVHKLRPDTKVTVAGRVTTAGRASKNSPTPAKGTSVFGNDDDIHPKLKDLYKQQFGSEPEEPKEEEPFEGGDSVLNKVTDLLPPGSGFVNKKTGDNITVKRYDADNMYVSYDKIPGKELKWPMKQFLKMTANKELQFSPKPKENNIQSAIKGIANFTDSNDHNGAVMSLAKMMGDESSIAEMEKIEKYHQLKGHMPQSLTKYRSSILNNLLTQAKKKYGNKVAKQLNNAF